jgi:phage protein D
VASSQAISYTLTINGAPAPQSLISSVQTLQIEDHSEMADLLRIKLTIGVRSDGSGWTVLDDDAFPRLTKIEVQAKIGNAAETLINAYVIETSVNFSTQPGQTVLTVVAMDPSVLMNLEEKVRPWPDMSDSDIASAIFSEHGFTAKVKSSQPARSENEQRTMQRGTDIQFLRQLSKRNGYECYVETAPTGEVEGHFHPPATDQKPQGVLTVNMGQDTNVSAFAVRHDMLRPTTVKMKGLDLDSLSDQPAESQRQTDNNLGRGAAAPADRPRVVLLTGSGLSKAGELQTAAQAVVDRSGWAIGAEGELNASTYGAVLRAKRPVLVRGVGRVFGGTYYVERVLHIFSGDGWKQRFTLRRNALGLTGRESFQEDKAL